MSNHNENGTERSHAVLGGSKASYWEPCPGSIFYLKDLPEQEVSEAMLSGTHAHAVAEVKLYNFLNYKVTGEENARPLPAVCSSDMIEMADGYVKAIWENVLEQTINRKAWGIEEQFTLDAQLEMFGHLDFWAVYTDDHGKRVGVIGDFKSGFKYKDADKNPQLAFYACCLLEELQQAGKDLDYVRAFIYQPKAYGVEAYRETKFTNKQLAAWKKRFYKAAHQIFVKQLPKYKVGEWCQDCPAMKASLCTTYAKETAKRLDLKIIEPEKIKLPTIETLTDQQIANFCLYEDEITALIKAAKNTAVQRAKAGKDLPGVKVIEKPGAREWKENDLEIVEGLKTLGITEPYKTNVLRNLGDMEKELATIVGKEQVKTTMEKFCQRKAPSISIVPDSDPRPSIASNLTERLKIEDNENGKIEVL